MKSLVRAKMIAAVLERRIHDGFVADQVRRRAVGVGVEGDAVAVARADLLQDQPEIGDPVAVRVIRCHQQRVPGRGAGHQHQVVGMAGHSLDGRADRLIAGRVAGRGDRLAHRIRGLGLGRRRIPIPIRARPLDGMVGLVADDPVVRAGRIPHEVGAALGKLRIVAFVGQGSGSRISGVETHQHAEVAVGQVAIVAAAGVVGIGANLLGHQHPAGHAEVEHVLLASGIV